MVEAVDKTTTKELLLLCSALGSKIDVEDEETGLMNERFIPAPECKGWLNDLLRAVKGDDEKFRQKSLLCSQWNLASTTLMPLTLSTKLTETPDRRLLFTMVKLMVALTKPLVKEARMAARTNVNIKVSELECVLLWPPSLSNSQQRKFTNHPPQSKKTTPESIQRHQEYKENAIAQNNALIKYKTLFLKKDVLGVFVNQVSEPIGKKAVNRIENDNHVIELFLHLVRNLVAIGPQTSESDPAIRTAHKRTHQELIVAFGEEVSE